MEIIIEAATQILADKGWRGLTTNAIAQKAGVSIGSVYEYFANKQEIVDVVLDRHLARAEVYLRGFSGFSGDGLPMEHIVEMAVRGFIAIHQGDPKLHRVISNEVPLSTLQRNRIDKLRSDAVELLAQFLEGRTEDAWLKASIVVDAADALTHRWFINEAGIPVSAEAMSQELTKMLRLYVSS
ncbi:TetR/AcrR family transcriptional regulator [Sphingorhabdus sp.]|uniref:TetR/AcrR family transcriptional regulator n=1 Tax=Sphingorhabdus sp. TaxID=1902408 RepID=UPI0037C695DB